MNKVYPKVNTELLELIKNKDFDKEKARRLLASVGDINGVVSYYLFGEKVDEYATSYVEQAVDYANIRMVFLLFEFGADPNSVSADVNVLWNLQYQGDSKEENAIRIEIVKLFLQQGADQLMDPGNEGESLLDWAEFGSANVDSGSGYEYRNAFCVLCEEELQKRGIEYRYGVTPPNIY